MKEWPFRVRLYGEFKLWNLQDGVPFRLQGARELPEESALIRDMLHKRYGNNDCDRFAPDWQPFRACLNCRDARFDGMQEIEPVRVNADQKMRSMQPGCYEARATPEVQHNSRFEEGRSG